MVCPIPGWEGSDNAAKPFLGVRTFFQTAKAKNATLASTFLNDTVMTTEFMDGMYAVDPRPPAWLESFEKAASDPVIKAFGDVRPGGRADAEHPRRWATSSGTRDCRSTRSPPVRTRRPRSPRRPTSINKANADIG